MNAYKVKSVRINACSISSEICRSPKLKPLVISIELGTDMALKNSRNRSEKGLPCVAAYLELVGIIKRLSVSTSPLEITAIGRRETFRLSLSIVQSIEPCNLKTLKNGFIGCRCSLNRSSRSIGL